MTSPAEPPPARARRAPPIFQPRFTLVLLYLFGFFLLYCFLLALPALLDALASLPQDAARGPEWEAAAEAAGQEAAQKALAGKLLPAFLLAILTAALGAYYRVLPGFRGEG